MLAVPLLARTPEEIRAEAWRALALHPKALARDVNEARRIEAHVATYRWLLGDIDVAPYTGRRVPALTARDLAIEQDAGRDLAEQGVLPYNHQERIWPEAVFDAIAWAIGEFDDPPSGD